MSWQLWIDPMPRPGWANMAIDSALLDRADRQGQGWLRLYRWAPYCLSFGRHEPALRRYNRHYIEAQGLAVVRRPTGGRAVWHAGELTYAVAAPAARLGALREAYLAIHEMLRQALQTLGAEAQLAPARRAAGVDAGACFSQPAGGEVMVAGRKVVGSAQLRQGDAFLQHGSILLEDDQAMVGAISLTTVAGGAPPDLAAPLHRVLERAVPPDEVSAAVAQAAALAWPGDWHRVAEPDDVLHDAAAYTERFRSTEWTWSR